MQLWSSALAIVGIYTLAVMSPGPNFLVITRNALAYSRRIGLQTALGVASGSILWIAFGFFGVAVVFSQIPLLFTAVKILGVTYLTYAALKLLRIQFQFGNDQPTRQDVGSEQSLPSREQAFKHGLLTQMSNPKAALFVLALFSSVVSPITTIGIKLILTLVMTTVSLSWYLFVATIFSDSRFQLAYGRFQRPANVLFAVMLLYLALNILLSA